MSKTLLLESLTECAALLNEVEETFWAAKIEKAVNMLRSGHTLQSVEEVLSWFGGMGSFNDLMISRINGHRVKEEEEEQVNKTLEQLQTIIFQEARKLKREALLSDTDS